MCTGHEVGGACLTDPVRSLRVWMGNTERAVTIVEEIPVVCKGLRHKICPSVGVLEKQPLSCLGPSTPAPRPPQPHFGLSSCRHSLPKSLATWTSSMTRNSLPPPTSPYFQNSLSFGTKPVYLLLSFMDTSI